MAHTIDYKDKMAQGYDYSAEFYDDVAGGGMTSYTHLLLNDLKVPDNPVVLDVACGTGIATFGLMTSCDNAGSFYGIDISPGMIAKAQENAERRGLENCTFRIGDAERLEFPDGMFDVVISSGSFHWFPDKWRALREMYRVLKPGGQVALRFNGQGSWKRIFAILIQLERDTPGLSMTPSWTTIRDYFSMTLEEVDELFDEVGFNDVRVHGIHRLTYLKPDQMSGRGMDSVWAFWQIGFSQETIAKYKIRLQEEMLKQSKTRGFPYRSSWIIAYGRKRARSDSYAQA
jgi:ubiquinone/menaquinone biosynthesis C-methylase UbiE